MVRLNRKKRIRFKIRSVSNRDRLTIFKSNNHLYVQIVNDAQGKTVASVSSLEKDFKDKYQGNKKNVAEELGKEIAKRSIKNGIKKVAFDKGKYKYHGIIKTLAEAARVGGLEF